MFIIMSMRFTQAKLNSLKTDGSYVIMLYLILYQCIFDTQCKLNNHNNNNININNYYFNSIIIHSVHNPLIRYICYILISVN